MKLQGNIRVSGPELINFDRAFKRDGKEFIIMTHKKRGEHRLEDFNLWADISEESVLKIATNYKDGEKIQGFITLELMAGRGGSLDISLNLKQASMIIDVLEKYVRVFYDSYALRTVRECKLE